MSPSPKTYWLKTQLFNFWASCKVVYSESFNFYFLGFWASKKSRLLGFSIPPQDLRLVEIRMPGFQWLVSPLVARGLFSCWMGLPEFRWPAFLFMLESSGQQNQAGKAKCRNTSQPVNAHNLAVCWKPDAAIRRRHVSGASHSTRILGRPHDGCGQQGTLLVSCMSRLKYHVGVYETPGAPILIPRIVRSAFSKDPSKVPLISETPISRLPWPFLSPPGTKLLNV